ncbi:MAG: hypothetical protein IT221_09985 [Fluviicola sp.]|nr:hypothetical protein [Fluviicola sp.]
MNKTLWLILLIFSNCCFSQSEVLSQTAIETYAKSIDQSIKAKKLVKVFYPNMSACGGGLYGYFQNKQLVCIDATYGAELGFSSRKMYIKNGVIYKIIYKECFAEWGKYDRNYPADKFEFDPSKMTYTDDVYTILLANQVRFTKSSHKKNIPTKPDNTLIDQLLECGKQMQADLTEVIHQMDQLKLVKEMPYICEMDSCGDSLFWDVLSISPYNIEYLIEQLDDSTSSQANVILFGGTYTVADIAYDAISEIIHGIPTFELLGIPFDKEGCGYCAYWQQLRSDHSKRIQFKLAVRKWYFANEKNLVWVESDDFAICDCRGKHPNRGHYEVKK